ncbi:MAG: carboxylesterase family protein [Flavobacteriales bacterium]|nr:carboxylesterase family protein [Flavobacteriales bacterium]
MRNLNTAIVAAFALNCSAQECGNGRYATANFFPDVSVTSAVVFGSNTGVNGSNQTLRMDVYEPSGDALALRPVVICAFGGSFVGGSRADVAPICTDMAKRGFVAVANDYRVGFFLPNQTTTMRAVMRGAHDMNACVRYLRKSVAELGNPYGIDTTRIYIGGVSAGAISALHAMYLDQDSEIPSQIAGELPGLGGLEGNSGSPGYSSRAHGIYSFSGAIGDSSWVVAGDPPLASIHEEGDGVVPYYTAPVYVVGLPTGLTASGSHDIHLRAAHQGLVHCFKSYPGNGHVGYLSSDQANALNWTALFLSELACGTAVSCGLSTAITDASDNRLMVAPNPTHGPVRFELPTAALVELLDLTGRVLLQERLPGGPATLDLGPLPVGVYVIRTEGRTVATIVRAD